jgi:hypothetical protein
MTNYDVAEYLATEGDRAGYLDSWRKADVARATDLIKLQGSKDENKGN